MITRLYAPSLWTNLTSIPDDHPITYLNPNRDYIVAKKREITLTLNNGSIYRAKDLIILGKLHIVSTHPDNKAVKPTLIVRDVITMGEFSIHNVHLKAENGLVGSLADLQNRFIEWMQFQRETVDNMGLRSVVY